MRDLLQPPSSAAPAPAAPTVASDAPKFEFRRYFYMIVRRLWLLVLCFFVSVSVMLKHRTSSQSRRTIM